MNASVILFKIINLIMINYIKCFTTPYQVNLRKCNILHCNRQVTTTSHSDLSIPSKYVKIKDVDEVIRGMHYIDIGHSNTSQPPLLILAGTAQTINTYIPHIKQLSKTRRVLLPELRCQGKHTELLPHHSTLETHSNDVMSFLNTLEIQSCDIIGFSFGGRLGITLAAYYPSLVRRLSVTGVPYIRPPLGEQILNEWKNHLIQGDYYTCGQSFLYNGYSEQFITHNKHRLDIYINMILETNHMNNIYHLINQSHPQYNQDKYSIQSCTSKVICPTQVIAATHDRIAGIDSVLELSQNINNAVFHEINSGHLAPFENPGLWRKLVLDFLNH